MKGRTHNPQSTVQPAWMRRALTGGLWRLGSALRRWALRGVAVLIVIELGLLSPLSCVVHCLIQQLLAERAPITLFLCGEHGLAAARGGQAADPAPASTLMPRALYELIFFATPLLVAAGLLVATLTLRPPQRLAPPVLPPPTPPPRLSLA